MDSCSLLEYGLRPFLVVFKMLSLAVSLSATVEIIDGATEALSRFDLIFRLLLVIHADTLSMASFSFVRSLTACSIDLEGTTFLNPEPDDSVVVDFDAAAAASAVFLFSALNCQFALEGSFITSSDSISLISSPSSGGGGGAQTTTAATVRRNCRGD